ncbi:MAG: YraN family protein [Clostridia bacterium]|nr:YraN family protein [Clostridia bacterium]
MEKGTRGKKGEEFAAEYYRKLGYLVKEMNYHSRYGEVDVIAENDFQIVFCEVKTRSSSTRTNPCEAVDFKKQQKLTLTAFKYLENRGSDKMPRFDVFEVWIKEGRIYKFNNIENAFEAVDFSGRYDLF